jgi:hypothetical protein
MSDTYGVLGGTDAASLIQRQPGDGHEWKSIARGKLEDVRALAAMLNEAELVRALTDGHNDVAMPAGLPDHLQPAAAPDFLESNRKALEDEVARPLFPAGGRERVNLAQRKTPERCNRCGIRISVFGYRLLDASGFYCPDCNSAHPDPAALLPLPNNGRTSINWSDVTYLRNYHPGALDELRARRWAEGDRILDGKGGRLYTAQAARFLEERNWK